MSVNRYGIMLGPLTIHFYGVILMLGILAGTWLAARQAKRRGLSTDFIWDAMIWVLIFGVVGARLWHILTPPPSMVAQGITTQYYLTHPMEAIAIWHGGLGILGAVGGGMTAFYIYVRKCGQSFAVWADVVAPGLALGQAIGRWGNFVNQELYGRPTHLPWAIYIDQSHRAPGFEQFSHFHPAFLYESLWNLGNMALLLWLGKRYATYLKDGDLILTYLVVYPIGRFMLEFLRLDSSQVANLNANQVIMLIIAVLASSVLVWRHNNLFSNRLRS